MTPRKRLWRIHRWTLSSLVSLLGMTAIAWNTPPEIDEALLGRVLKASVILMWICLFLSQAWMVWCTWRWRVAFKRQYPDVWTRFEEDNRSPTRTGE